MTSKPVYNYHKFIRINSIAIVFLLVIVVTSLAVIGAYFPAYNFVVRSALTYIFGPFIILCGIELLFFNFVDPSKRYEDKFNYGLGRSHIFSDFLLEKIFGPKVNTTQYPRPKVSGTLCLIVGLFILASGIANNIAIKQNLDQSTPTLIYNTGVLLNQHYSYIFGLGVFGFITICWLGIRASLNPKTARHKIMAYIISLFMYLLIFVAVLININKILCQVEDTPNSIITKRGIVEDRIHVILYRAGASMTSDQKGKIKQNSDDPEYLGRNQVGCSYASALTSDYIKISEGKNTHWFSTAENLFKALKSGDTIEFTYFPKSNILEKIRLVSRYKQM